MARGKGPRSDVGEKGDPRKIIREKPTDQEVLIELEQGYQKILAQISGKKEEGKEVSPRTIAERRTAAALNELSPLLAEEHAFGERERAILRLKLVRYFQDHDDLDIQVMADALRETPNFLRKTQGKLQRALDDHRDRSRREQVRLQREEISDDVPERLLSTASGRYYLARLSCLAHLQQDTRALGHCVGNQPDNPEEENFYLRKIKFGEREIFSLRSSEDDIPVLTIEYDPKRGEIVQMRGKETPESIGGERIADNDPLLPELLNALSRLRGTTMDTGRSRNISRVARGETKKIVVPQNNVLTEKGIIPIHDLNPEEQPLLFKIGKIGIPKAPKEDVAKLASVLEHQVVTAEQIAYIPEEITEDTRVYTGPLVDNIFQLIPENVLLYKDFPEGRVEYEKLGIGGTSKNNLKARIKNEGHEFWGAAEPIIDSEAFTTLAEAKEMTFVRFSVADLGFPNGARWQEISARALALGLDFCPAETGLHYRLHQRNQPMYQFVFIGTEPIFGADGSPRVFVVARFDGGSYLSSGWAGPDGWWSAGFVFLFRVSKKPLAASSVPIKTSSL